MADLPGYIRGTTLYYGDPSPEDPPTTTTRNLLTGYQHAVSGEDNFIAGQNNEVNGSTSQAHGSGATVNARQSVLFVLDGVPFTLSENGVFQVNGKVRFNLGPVILPGGGGGVEGPVSSTDNAAARWNGTDGTTLQNSLNILQDDGRISSVTDPTSAQDAATKNYVDSLAVNLGKRGTVRAATTANITIATALNNGDSLDGVALATGDLVLVKDQSTGSQNGVYVVGVSPARSAEFDTYNEHPGALIAVQEGTANADTLWLCTSNAGGTLNTTAIAFSALSVSAGITQLTGDVTAGPGSGSQAATIPNDTVTYAKMQNISAASKLLGRGSAAGSGDPQEITVGTGLSMSGTTLSASGSGGDVVGPSSSVDGEIALFDSTTGKLIKRATGTGFVRAASGVYSASKLKRVVGCIIGNGTAVISTGVAGFVSCPVAGTITKVRLLSSDPAVTSGSIVVDIWKDAYASYPPTVADTITASAKPTISSTTKAEDSTLTGWTTSVSAGDVFGFNVDSVTSLKRCTVELTVDE